MGGRWILALAIAGCSGDDELHPCDDGTPTCDSSLLVLLPDPRVDFRLYVEDANGMSIVVDCPIATGGTEDFGDYSVICGAGRLTITTFTSFADTVDVQLEEGGFRSFTPDYQRGADYCGTACTTGTIEL